MDASPNQKVWIWAHGQIGKRIGKGQCTDLAIEALKQSQAKSAKELGPIDDDADYVWGDVVSLREVQPGDILQLRNFVDARKVVRRVKFDDDSGNYTEVDEQPHSRPHHTAIVDAVIGPGVLRILEQHVKPGGEKVQVHVLYVNEIRVPLVSTVHKTVKTSAGKARPAQVTESATVAVQGQITAYRPKAR